MAGASDKARFYLEQYVPELQEYKRKEIFSHDEIKSIASKRSDFEHILNARGSKPSDYARYVVYETHLDRLRKKRCKRLGVKSTTFSGQRTIFFILDRATRKFPGDMDLWMRYIDFCQREEANKKLAKVFTKVLRLKPRAWNLWVLAAKHYAENQGDMTTARSYMQRGLRFCKDERKMWSEYMRLEMVYLAKLAARRKILGLDEKPNEAETKQNGENEDMLMLPIITSEDVNPSGSNEDQGIVASALQKLASAPAFTGGLALAIFDAAMKHFNGSTEVGKEFFDICASFEPVPSTRKILQHILESMQSTSHTSAEGAFCGARMRLFGIDARSEQFPAALAACLATIKRTQHEMPGKTQAKLAEHAVLMLLPYLHLREELDEGVLDLLEASILHYLHLCTSRSKQLDGGSQDALTTLVAQLRKEGQDPDAEIVEQYAGAMQID